MRLGFKMLVIVVLAVVFFIMMIGLFAGWTGQSDSTGQGTLDFLFGLKIGGDSGSNTETGSSLLSPTSTIPTTTSKTVIPAHQTAIGPI